MSWIDRLKQWRWEQTETITFATLCKNCGKEIFIPPDGSIVDGVCKKCKKEATE